MKKSILNILKGTLISIITTFIFLTIFATILTYTELNENTINPVIIVVTSISILIGSSIVNIKIKKSGMINGALIGGIYMITIYLISSIFNRRFGLNIQGIIMIVTGIICGIIGGIIGVNCYSNNQ